LTSPFIELHGGWLMYVNEEGKLKRLLRNDTATAMVLVGEWGDFIVGPALIVRVQEERK